MAPRDTKSRATGTKAPCWKRWQKGDVHLITTSIKDSLTASSEDSSSKKTAEYVAKRKRMTGETREEAIDPDFEGSDDEMPHGNKMADVKVTKGNLEEAAEKDAALKVTVHLPYCRPPLITMIHNTGRSRLNSGPDMALQSGYCQASHRTSKVSQLPYLHCDWIVIITSCVSQIVMRHVPMWMTITRP